MEEQSSISGLRFSLQRHSGEFFERMRAIWRGKKLVRWAVYAGVLLIILWALFWVFLTRDLPDAESLVDYET
ncbi:MAG: hypothetical protein ABJH26_11435, partial [Marinomonas sp.]